jgi:hypothetical protein
MISRPLFRRIALFAALSLAMLTGFASACTPVRHVLVTADPLALGPPARPDLFASLPEAPRARLQAWRAQRPHLLDQLETRIYGAAPSGPDRVTLGRWTPVTGSGEPGGRYIADVTIQTEAAATLTLHLGLVMPEPARPVRGVLLVPTECGLQAALHDPAMPAPDGFTPSYCEADGWLADLIGPLFGEWISGPPAARVLDHGYAIAAWHESDIAPDSAALHIDALRGLGLDPDAEGRPGVISLWAWTISRAIDALTDDPRFADAPFIAYGHSRRGKAVLLAAARDDRIAVTLAHQSGTGGAALQNDRVGEPIASIVQTYPHWFTPRYGDYADAGAELPVDQHALLALIAPRAVLIGAAWRDVWADPAGAFRAAEAASEAWAIYSRPGLVQDRMADFDPSGGVASHIRPGTHGVTDADWDAFLAFMDAHTPAR